MSEKLSNPEQTEKEIVFKKLSAEGSKFFIFVLVEQKKRILIPYSLVNRPDGINARTTLARVY